MSTADTYTEQIKEFIMTEVNPDMNLQQLDDDEPLLDSGIVDSLGVLRILAFLDETFGIDLSGDEINLEQFRTVRSIRELIEHNQS